MQLKEYAVLSVNYRKKSEHIYENEVQTIEYRIIQMMIRNKKLASIGKTSSFLNAHIKNAGLVR